MNDDIKIIDSDAARELQRIVNRVENLEREKKGLMADITETFKEAKEDGWDVKTIKEILKRRKLSQQEIQEQEYLLEAYSAALDGKVKGAELEEDAA